MKVVFRDSAYDDLDRIFNWIAKDRPRSAHAVIGRILDSTERLGRFPRLGHIGRASNTLEWVVTGLPYVVVYRVNAGVDVIDVIASVARIERSEIRERRNGRDQPRIPLRFMRATCSSG